MMTFGNEDLGVDTTGRDFLPFSDLEQSVRDDVETLRNSDLIPDGVLVSGAIHEYGAESSVRWSKANARRGQNVRPEHTIPLASFPARDRRVGVTRPLLRGTNVMRVT
jgi:hypothetical protein